MGAEGVRMPSCGRLSPARGELFFNFALSFVLLCLLWMTHVRQFEHIVRVDSYDASWLNNARLLFIVLVPFTTGTRDPILGVITPGRMLLPLNFFFAILLSWLQWKWAVAAPGEEMNARPVRGGCRGLTAGAR